MADKVLNEAMPLNVDPERLRSYFRTLENATASSLHQIAYLLELILAELKSKNQLAVAVASPDQHDSIPADRTRAEGSCITSPAAPGSSPQV